MNSDDLDAQNVSHDPSEGKEFYWFDIIIRF